MCAMAHIWRSEDTMWNCFYPFTFMWIPVIGLRLGLHRKYTQSMAQLAIEADVFLLCKPELQPATSTKTDSDVLVGAMVAAADRIQ